MNPSASLRAESPAPLCSRASVPKLRDYFTYGLNHSPSAEGAGWKNDRLPASGTSRGSYNSCGCRGGFYFRYWLNHSMLRLPASSTSRGSCNPCGCRG